MTIFAGEFEDPAEQQARQEYDERAADALADALWEREQDALGEADYNEREAQQAADADEAAYLRDLHEQGVTR